MNCAVSRLEEEQEEEEEPVVGLNKSFALTQTVTFVVAFPGC